MKRNIAFSFIMATLIGLSLVANAQTEKGKILLDASSSLDFTSLSSKWETDYNSGDGGKTSSFDFSPAVGYFVANNLAFGIMLELSTTTEKDDYDKY
ncbi:hypothetical protein, partial [Mangrovibacterium sp.]|uniref:hypothetical protein n=1 Tax=Mangrovibacterium sp. TaxID=1961364 RepID=UPI0035689E73